MKMSAVGLRGAALLLSGTAMFSLAGCGSPDTKIAQVTPAKPEDTKVPPAMSTKERLRVPDMPGATAGGDNPHAGMSLPGTGAAQAPAAGGVPAGPDAAFTYALPTGWTEAATSPMRVVNLKAGEASECYITVLGGDGGGLASNLNRWRKQMGQPDLAEAELAALPKRPLLGAEATQIVIDGAFSGMGAAEAKPDYRMVGLAQVAGGRAVFVKFTGPRAEIEAQMAGFDAFIASLGEGGAPAAAAAPETAAPSPTPTPAPEAAAPAETPAAAPAAATPAPGPMVPAPTGAALDTSKLQWTAPPSWTRGADRVMRLVTYTVGQSECYITLLDGPAGGLDANLNRWRGQMGAPALSAEEIAQLPKLTVLGKDGLLLDVAGTYTTMSGQTLNGQRMLGLICLLDKGLLTVKMTGPAAEVGAELENFKAFCASIAMN